MGSNKYMHAIADTQYELYHRLGFEDLCTSQNNLGVRLREDSETQERVTCVAEDRMCEHQAG